MQAINQKLYTIGSSENYPFVQTSIFFKGFGGENARTFPFRKQFPEVFLTKRY